MKKDKSQTRETLEKVKHLILLHIDQHLVIGVNGVRQAAFPMPREAVLYNLFSCKKELWIENDNYDGHVIEIDGMGFKFVREIK